MSTGFLVWLPLFTASRQAQSRHRFKSQTRARTSFASASYRLVGDRIRDIIGKGHTIDTYLRETLLEGKTPTFSDHITCMVSNTKARKPR